MDALEKYKIHALVVGEHETGYRVIVGKKYKNAGVVTLIVFDKEEYHKNGNIVFHVWVTNDKNELRCHETYINQKFAVKYDSEF